MKSLFGLKSYLDKANLSVILIQIDEAHSDAWPLALENQPPEQKTFQDRIQRAKYFINNYHPPYPVFIDSWTNDFAELFNAWPDKYHCVNQELKVIAKSEYGTGDSEACIIKDYVELLRELAN